MNISRQDKIKAIGLKGKYTKIHLPGLDFAKLTSFGSLCSLLILLKVNKVKIITSE